MSTLGRASEFANSMADVRAASARRRAWSHVPIAKLRYSPTQQAWSLFWCDRNLNWHRYDRVGAAAHVDPLLAEIDADPTAIFWG